MTEPRSLVVRLLDTPDIARVVPRLAPEVLHRLIDRCGLEACADLLTLTTPKQLQRLLDVDLWRAPQPGGDETLDAARFGEWLEVLLELDPPAAADRLAAIDVDLVVGGLASHVRVFDAGAVSAYTALDGERMDHYVRRGPIREIAGFVVEPRRSPAWEAVVDLLVVLQAERPALFERVMRACVRLSDGERERDSAEELPDARGQQLADLAAGRQRRRDRDGFVAAADARAFLHAARDVRLDAPRRPRHPIAGAYVRDLLPVDGAEDGEVDAGVSEAPVAAVLDILADAGLLPPPRALLPQATASETPRALLESFLASHASAAEALAFLANVALAGCGIHDRALTPREAAELVAATCNLGLENWPAAWGSPDLVTAFQIGWTLLHHDLGAPAARTLAAVLDDLHCADPDVQWSLVALRQDLFRALARREPWKARPALDAVLALDAVAWAVLRGITDECPNVHPAVHGAARRIDPGAYTFVSTNAQIAEARVWLASLSFHLSGPTG